MALLTPMLPFSALLICLIIFLTKIYLRPKPKTIGFMHPNASARGGGERVLWAMVQSIRINSPDYEIIIYLRGDEKLSSSEILSSTKKCFGLDLSEKPPKFVRINFCKYADPHKWKRLTLVFEAMGSILATVEAIFKFTPEIFIDTTGYGFSLSIPKLISRCKTMAYIHYPIISTDMINGIYSGTSYNNSSTISSSKSLMNGKYIYYKILHFIYKLSVYSCDHIWANSTWTKNHIGDGEILYPPCDTTPNADMSSKRENLVISVAQFRPEKNHKILVEAFADFLKGLDQPDYRLVMIGGCRNEEDLQRMNELKKLSEKLGIAENIEFKPNLPYPELQDFQKRAKIGIHAMENEHFGIVVVEFQANGVIPLAHNSAGPKEDIVTKSYGYLADSKQGFTEALLNISRLSDDELYIKRREAYRHSQKFSHASFLKKFGNSIQKYTK